MNRSGQDEGTAHILIALIAILIVLFILFLPPEERAALLETGTLVDGETGTASGLLLDKSVGRLEFYPPEGFDHPIPSVLLFEARNAKVLQELPSFIVSRNWFVDRRATFPFLIDDLEHTKNVMLAFDAPVASGALRVWLNGEQIHEGIVNGPTIEPIKVPPTLLRAENEISFAASGVGGWFWRSNTITVQNPRIIGDLTDITRTSASSVFVVSPTEKENLLSATLVALPVCESEDTGILTISVNDQPAYTGVPECGIPLKQSIPLGALIAGTNTIRFSVDRGELTLERIILDTDLKEVRTFIEYFEVPPALFESAIRGGRRVVLQIDFVDDGKRKRAQLNVNGHLTIVDQEEPFYSRVINSWLQPGARNYLEIVPETPLEIVSVRVGLA